MKTNSKYTMGYAYAFSAVSIFSVILTSLPSTAQNRPAQPPRNPVTPTSWSQVPNIEKDFMQGCVGQQNLQPNQRTIKQNFCQCAFTAYKSRYTPQLFSQINVLSVQVGQNGPRLVNLMMKPEIDRCSAQTNYHP
ncbi:hypothetical protein H6G76_19730 [Nostoc sp. FACHB-152]|uniref:hypothetical protein n=1 Tax=unclassified Nostoc TaxID=2593658 RepID=UPI0016852511|nr:MULTISPECIES: hypothetical protein [unclassified Nostoc]MBD2449350.1 hypothetical protein [Nostoc sp. FACHB-152]MBD2470482.1 hypothetical protein [Nostoc sp. FACHB-145]